MPKSRLASKIVRSILEAVYSFALKPTNILSSVNATQFGIVYSPSS